MEIFRVRLNCVDHYQASPTHFDPPLFGIHGSTQHRDGPKVPVIRVFGATETGQKVCAHIHGVLPYLYIEYDGSLDTHEVDAYIHKLRASIDHALAVSYRRNIYGENSVFVGHITLVKGIPFFGYHVGYRYFLKIYMLNPLNMTRFADLLYQGAILKRVFQPLESHLQYLLQWMCDFNLYGCSYIDCRSVRFRSPIPDYLDMPKSTHRWHSQSIPPTQISDCTAFQRQSHCAIEVDIYAEDILNRLEVQPRHLHQDFAERFNAETPQEKLIHSMAGLWRDETRRRKLKMGLDDPSSSPFPPEVLISMSAESRKSEKCGWVHEEELRGVMHEMIRQEKRDSDESIISFNDFVKPTTIEIQTASESVADLFTERLQRSLSIPLTLSQSEIRNESTYADAMVDAKVVLDVNSPNFSDSCDENIEVNALNRERTESSEHAINASHAARLSDQDVNSDSMTAEIKRPVNPSRTLNLNGTASLDEDGPAVKKRKLSDADAPPGINLKLYNTEFDKVHKRPQASGEGLGISTDVNKSQAHPLEKSGQDLEGQSLQPLTRMHRVAFENLKDRPKSETYQKDLNPENTSEHDIARLTQSSQGSIKAHGSQGKTSLAFPVVKDPYDPETILRLSQRNGDSGSQATSQDTKKSSAMGFDTATDAVSSQRSSSKASSTVVLPTLESASQTWAIFKDFNEAFNSCDTEKTFVFRSKPPSRDVVSSTIALTGLPPVIYQEAYYSNENDVPDHARDYAGREFKIASGTVPYLATFDPTGKSPANFGEKAVRISDKSKDDLVLRRQKRQCTLRNWEFHQLPPARIEVEDWLERENMQPKSQKNVEVHNIPQYEVQYDKIKLRPAAFQPDGPTQMNPYGFKFSQKKKSTSVRHETHYMSTMSLEIHANSRAHLTPNPEEDAISCIFWCLKSDDDIETDDETNGRRIGMLLLAEAGATAREVAGHVTVEVKEEDTELDLINSLVDLVRELDPDILVGYEVHNSSWGYLIERARLKYEYDLCDEFSRVKSQSHGRFGREADRWGFNKTSTIRVTGRHMINIWRAMRNEINLLQYTMENVVFHLLRKRIPHFSFRDLTTWYKNGKPRDLAKCLNYFLSRVKLDLEILEANELIPRTSEQARLLGVDFFSVFSRGSQFKVESFMFRLAKPENFILVSPSRKQVGQQNALECLPLVMEPQSDFYASPVLVLDFQSLYPSIMIAYNYCYSTCLGRVVRWRDQNKLGFTNFQRQPRILELVQDFVNIAPNGMMYVKPEMRKSLLAKMLSEILETRVMVKSGMKVDKEDRSLQQLLNNRQLALKLLANVTYGYTSASFSGRMPCSEIADSIVQTARETLEKAIAKIHSVTRWGADVVYGDTDSIFVHLKGRTKDQAFEIGEDIAKTITEMNPRPLKLKFEKVYFPCVLLAKKRYVGFKYESKSQTQPEFDAKGIETVRRDGTIAEQKLEEKALKILFRTADLSQVKAYFQREVMKVMLGKVSIQDFCFAREVKLGTYSEKGPPPPGALISTKRMLEDPRLEPQYGERVPYVVVTGAPGARLIDRCISPEEILKDEGALELDAEYYISKNLIPPLERIFNLVGANVRQWYDEMPKVQRVRELYTGISNATERNGTVTRGLHPSRKTMESYMKTSACLVCKSKLPPQPKEAATTLIPLCRECIRESSTSLYSLLERVRVAQRKAAQLESICRSCSGFTWAEEVRCDSKDCPAFYARIRARTKEGRIRELVEEVRSLLEDERSACDW